MRLYVFGAEWCAGCKQLKKSKTIERFGEAHPEVKVVEVNADSPRGERLLNAWGMEGIPAFVFTEDDFDDRTIGKAGMGDKSEEEDTEDVEDNEVVLFKDMGGTLSDLEKFYVRAQKEEAKRG